MKNEKKNNMHEGIASEMGKFLLLFYKKILIWYYIFTIVDITF